MTLTEFLLARIAEDEAAAQTTFDPRWTAHPEMAGQPIIDATGHRLATAAEAVMDHIARHDPARVLANCERDRRIVELHAPYPVPQRMTYGTITACEECGSVDDSPVQWPCPTLRYLALPYADHPDYDETWRS